MARCIALLFFLAATASVYLPAAFSAEVADAVPKIKVVSKGAEGAISPPETPSIPDPHQMECGKCHLPGADNKPEAALITGTDSIALCSTCHAGVNLHPLDLEPQPLPSAAAPFPLPLGSGSHQGKIVCLTCHYIHGEEFQPYLLRGKSSGRQSVRQNLCSTCHREHFAGISPHTASDQNCLYCHIASPQKRKGKGRMSAAEIDDGCLYCHWTLRKNHNKDLDPFPDPLVQPQLLGPSDSARGAASCLTCHIPHGGPADNHLITKQYLQLAALSRSINPHWKNLMCISCHRAPPTKGNPVLLGSGDLNELCNRCHQSQFARADIHPVGIIPSKQVKIPADLPLQDGKITCETCHQSSLQESARALHSVGKENPKFLRRSGFTRNEFCFICHVQENYRRLNPHQQLDEQGHLKKETCLLCHASLPDIYVSGVENVKFIAADPNEYCIGCHPGFSETHPAGGHHLVAPSAKIMKALSTAIDRIGVELPLYNGKVVCATCHNPHDLGVIKYPPSATGPQRENKLRLMPGLIQCTGCHWDKG